MDGGRSKVTFDRFKSWLISTGVSDACIDLFLDYLADEENIFEEDYGSRRFAAEWFDLWSEFEENIEDELEESKKKINEAVEKYVHPTLRKYPDIQDGIFYACYTLDEDGGEEDHFDDFDNFLDAISACKQKTNDTHQATHACIIARDSHDPDSKDFFNSYGLINYEVVAEFSPDAEDLTEADITRNFEFHGEGWRKAEKQSMGLNESYDDDEEDDWEPLSSEEAVRKAFPKLNETSISTIAHWYDRGGDAEDFDNIKDYSDYIMEDFMDVFWAGNYLDDEFQAVEKDMIENGYFEEYDFPD